jgi:hypothetical protein
VPRHHKYPSLADRLKAHTRVSPETGCWEWTGAINPKGYGRITLSQDGHRSQQSAHRVSHMVFNGPIEAGLHVLHSCDNRACINPAHLRAGTHAENMAEAKERGRTKKCGWHKYDRDLNIPEIIRRLYADGHYSQNELAEMFNYDQSNICKIVNPRKAA